MQFYIPIPSSHYWRSSPKTLSSHQGSVSKIEKCINSPSKTVAREIVRFSNYKQASQKVQGFNEISNLSV
jgi:hypothetical protein